jgi:hypothetical protein
MTATGSVTATEAATATGAVTESEEVTPAEEVTGTEEVTATEELTGTEEITGAAEVTATETTTASEAVTATEEMTTNHAMTETTEISPEISPSAVLTSTTGVSGTAAVSNTRVFFLQPTSNAVVPLTFTVAISYTGVELGTGHDHGAANAGHIHLLIDSDFVAVGQGIPDDESHHHFEDSATPMEVSLTPGSHILRLQFADSNHIALEGDQYRQEIIVNAVDGAPEQSVRIASPTTGATVPPTFTVVMAATGLSVQPSGAVSENAGHFHLLIDEPFVAAGEVIPSDATHIHFGKAQLTTTLTLEPGTHLLRLQFADGAHHALAGDQYRAEAQVIVDENAPAEQVMFVKPADGATVTSPFLVGWAASGLIIEAAGKSIRPEGGHLHLLVDEDFIPGGEAIPMDETHLHFGKGQTSTELTLEPGEHVLRLQMANGAHIAQDGPQYQDEITVTVK